MFFEELINFFLDYKAKRIKISTLEEYKNNKIVLIKHFGNVEITNITSIKIQLFLDDYSKEHKIKTVKNIFYFIKSLIKFAEKFSLISKNQIDLNILELPITNTKRTLEEIIKQKEKENKIYTIDDLNNIFEQINITEEEKFIFYFGLYTGMRIGEILALTWEDIDFTNKKISVTKNLLKRLEIIDTPKNFSSIRKIFISDELFEKLKQYQKRQNENRLFFGDKYRDKEENFVFRKKNGKRINYNVLLNSIIKIKRIEKDFHFHKLRHSFCSQYIKQGVNILFISKILGHSTLNTTQKIYTHLQENDLLDIMQKVKIL